MDEILRKMVEEQVNKVSEEKIKALVSDQLQVLEDKISRKAQEKIDAIQEEVKTLKRELEDIKEKYDLEEERNHKRSKCINLRSEVSEPKSEPKSELKNEPISENKKFGFLKEETRQKWKFDVEYRKRLIRIIKGDNHSECQQDVVAWLLERVADNQKQNLEVVRREKDSVWFECKDEELKNTIFQRRKFNKQQWYRIDEVMIEVERMRRFKVEEYANTRKVCGSTIRRIWDKIEIDGIIYGWDEKRREIYKVQ